MRNIRYHQIVYQMNTTENAILIFYVECQHHLVGTGDLLFHQLVFGSCRYINEICKIYISYVFVKQTVSILMYFYRRKSAELVYFQNDVIIRDITVSMISESSTWKLLVKVFLDVPLRILESIKGQIFLTLFVKNNKTITSSEQINISPNTKFHEVAITSNILVAKVFNLFYIYETKCCNCLMRYYIF